jgi:hypothetical protein
MVDHQVTQQYEEMFLSHKKRQMEKYKEVADKQQPGQVGKFFPKEPQRCTGRELDFPHS